MTSSQNRRGPEKEVDVDLLVFIERYASDLLKWDIISFFAQNPDLYDTADNIAQHVGRNPRAVRPELGDLVILGILEWGHLNGDHERLAARWRANASTIFVNHGLILFSHLMLLASDRQRREKALFALPAFCGFSCRLSPGREPYFCDVMLQGGNNTLWK